MLQKLLFRDLKKQSKYYSGKKKKHYLDYLKNLTDTGYQGIKKIHSNSEHSIKKSKNTIKNVIGSIKSQESITLS
jgi:hypothetical protein